MTLPTAIDQKVNASAIVRFVNISLAYANLVSELLHFSPAPPAPAPIAFSDVQ